MGESKGAAFKPITRPAAEPRLKHRVDEGSERGTLRHNNEGSQQEQDHDDGQDPPAPAAKK
jgi:hypothetical protein